MLTTNHEALRVASPRERNSATNAENGATQSAMTAQLGSLKALALKVLERNRVCNDGATRQQNDAQQLAENPACSVARPEPEIRASANGFRGLDDAALTRIIANTAKAHGLDPLALRGWCDPPALDAIRSGDPAELVAFAACVASAVRCGELCPGDGGEHGFSSRAKAADAHHGPVCCGDCGHFEPDAIGDGRGIGRCLAGVPIRPGVPARYPRAERYCRGFVAKDG